MARGGSVTIGRKPALMALALLASGLSAFAASHGLPKGDTSATACSSCDARHQNHARQNRTRLVTTRVAETTP